MKDFQVAQLALLHAINRFDPDRGAPFFHFLVPTVNGELRRCFRSSWSVRVSRDLQETSLSVQPVMAELQHELRRAPTAAEIGARLQLPTPQVRDAMSAAHAFRSRSIDVPMNHHALGHRKQTGHALCDESAQRAFHAVETKDVLERLLPSLSSRSRWIVELRFLDELSQAEIASIVGVSQMQISRLLNKALRHLAEVAA